MSKTPKRPSQRDDLKQRDGEGGAPRPKATARKPRSSAKRKVETVPDALSPETPSAVMESPEGNSYSSLPPAQGEVLTEGRNVALEGEQKQEDRRDPQIEVRDEVEQRVQTVAEAMNPSEVTYAKESKLPQPDFIVEERTQPEQRLTQQHTMTYELRSGVGEDGSDPSHAGHGERLRQAIEGWTPRLRATSDRMRNASGRAKVWTREIAVRQAQRTQASDQHSSPVYILAAITLGIPAVLMVLLVGMNPGILDGVFATLLTFLVISAVFIAAIFEIKRLADQRSDADPH